MQYVAYYRVSTVQQGRSGLGLESQQKTVEQFITGRDAELLDAFTEVESGKKSDRPLLDKALRRCMLSGATLVIAKLDRLSRDLEFIAKIQNSKIDFVCCDMPEANTLTIGMMATLAQYERELISERTKAGLAAAKARGQTLGNPNLQLVRNNDTTAATTAAKAAAAERNLQVRELITEMEAEQGRAMSLRELAESLNDAGYKTARGARFTATQVSRIKAA
jgi:DNA invertase Pin-like site-specific DNA recombinase